MAYLFSKDQVSTAITQRLHSLSYVYAAWMGGSSATGFEDELSDTDLVIIAESPELVFQELEKTLSVVSTIQEIWTVEDSPWKCLQKFYVFSEGPEVYYVDVCIFESQNSEDYREYFNKDRHGTPIVLLDKKDILKVAAENPKRETLPLWNKNNGQARFEVLYRTFLKESLRGKYIDAYLFYQRLVTLWVQWQRRSLSPQKYDFGLRYLYRDFPFEQVQEIEKYLKVQDIKTMQNFAKEIRKQFYQAMDGADR